MTGTPAVMEKTAPMTAMTRKVSSAPIYKK
jgi:hypothetical protein